MDEFACTYDADVVVVDGACREIALAAERYSYDSYGQVAYLNAGFTALAAKSDGTLVMVGYDSGGDGELLTFGYDAGTADGTGIYYYSTLASETTLPGESDGGVFLSQIVLDASGQVINAGGYDNTIWGFNPTATATRVWVQQDANWNVTSIEDSSGNVLERYDYTPYGQRTVLDSGWNAKAGGSDYHMTQGWQGKFINYVSNSWYSRNRDYDITTETWMTKDPPGMTNPDRMTNPDHDGPPQETHYEPQPDYVVKDGDTFSGIMKIYGYSYYDKYQRQMWEKANSQIKNFDKIRAGQQIHPTQ